MGTAKGLIAEARKTLGVAEYPPGSNCNRISHWYGIGCYAWCDMSVSFWAARSNNLDAIGGKFAYTVAHAGHFQQVGRWHYGTGGIKAGDVVFFDWSGSRSVGAIDHVGIVERVRGGTIYTIEGNISDMCKRSARNGAYIVGYGRPNYGKTEKRWHPWRKGAELGVRTLRFGDRGTDVLELQQVLNEVVR